MAKVRDEGGRERERERERERDRGKEQGEEQEPCHKGLIVILAGAWWPWLRLEEYS